MSERSLIIGRGKRNLCLAGMAGIATMKTPVNIGVIFFSFRYRRVAGSVTAETNSVFFSRIPSATNLVNLMFTSQLRVFVYTIISHKLTFHKNEAGLTNEPVSDSNKLPYLFSAPASKLMQNLEMFDSPRLPSWRIVFPDVRINADSKKPESPARTNKKVFFLFFCMVFCYDGQMGRVCICA